MSLSWNDLFIYETRSPEHRLASNWLYSWGWLWMSNPPASTSQVGRVTGMHPHTVSMQWQNGAQGFVPAWKHSTNWATSTAWGNGFVLGRRCNMKALIRGSPLDPWLNGSLFFINYSVPCALIEQQEMYQHNWFMANSSLHGGWRFADLHPDLFLHSTGLHMRGSSVHLETDERRNVFRGDVMPWKNSRPELGRSPKLWVFLRAGMLR